MDKSLSDISARRFPVSIKGVVMTRTGVILLKNERDEWELPGGKLESGETPEACLVREIREELKIETTTGELLDCWLYQITSKSEVLIVTFGCHPAGNQVPALSEEHKELGIFPVEDISRLNMPQGYKNSIYAWAKRTKVEQDKVASGPK